MEQGTKSLKKTTGSSGRDLKKLQGDTLDEVLPIGKKGGTTRVQWGGSNKVDNQGRTLFSSARDQLSGLGQLGSTIYGRRIHTVLQFLDEQGRPWEQFKQASLDRYGGLAKGNAYQLTALRQIGNVE